MAPINIEKEYVVGTLGVTEPLNVSESKSRYIEAQKTKIFFINFQKY